MTFIPCLDGDVFPWRTSISVSLTLLSLLSFIQRNTESHRVSERETERRVSERERESKDEYALSRLHTHTHTHTHSLAHSGTGTHVWRHGHTHTHTHTFTLLRANGIFFPEGSSQADRQIEAQREGGGGVGTPVAGP